jgi:hypothetical protein
MCALAGCEQVAVIGAVALQAGNGAAAGAAAQGGSAADAGMNTERDAAVSGCQPLAPAVCNPVMNSGCPDILSMQCAVDLAAETLAGYCIFKSPDMTGNSCLNTLVTESCPPRSTCVFGMCRRLCFCDADCPDAACCTEPVGERGFKACGAC